MENLRDYIKVYNNILEEEFLEKILEKINNESYEKVELEGINFEQLSLTEKNNWNIQFENESVSTLEAISSLIYNASVSYFEDVKAPLIPELQGFEGVKIRKFKDGYFHKMHLDVNDYKSAKRFLTVLIFLGKGNANVSFPGMGATIQMASNSVLLFPPTWMFPYEVTCSSEEPAYIVSSHLHYVG